MKRPNFSLPSITWQACVTISPVWFGLGIMAFFVVAPLHPLQFATLAVLLIALAVAYRNHTLAPKLLVGCLLALAGFAHISYHVAHWDVPILSKRYFFMPIEATVREVIREDNGVKLVLADLQSPTLREADRHVAVRITARLHADDVRRGQRIATKATLFPPSRPASPNAFDFRRYFYGQGIGGVGYMTGTLRILESSRAAPQAGVLREWQQRVRSSMERYIMREIEQPQASVLVALTLGKRHAIPDSTADILRDASLSHMLAISGMHMGIIAGLAFFGTRWLMACWPWLALTWPIKQIAAVLALCIGAAYLTLADFPLSAQRAYAMIALLFAAVLVRRNVDTLRSLTIAAWVVMLLTPLAPATISFQLSFIATLALILAYRRIIIRHDSEERAAVSRIKRAGVALLYIAFTSLIAGLATAPFVGYHFNRLPVYGILANMLAMPVLSFMVAPALLLSAFLWPVGLHDLPLYLAAFGVKLIIRIAAYVSDISYSTLHVPSYSVYAAIALTLCGLLALRYVRTWWHGAVSLVIALAVGYAGLANTEPHIMIAEDGSAIAIREEGQAAWIMIKGTPRNFHAEQWQQALGDTFVTLKEAQRSGQGEGWHCNDSWCNGILAGRTIRIGLDYKTDQPLCPSPVDVVLTTFYSDRWDCEHPPALRIGRSMLEAYGAHHITMYPGALPAVWRACDTMLPHFRWSGCAAESYSAPTQKTRDKL